VVLDATSIKRRDCLLNLIHVELRCILLVPLEAFNRFCIILHFREAVTTHHVSFLDLCPLEWVRHLSNVLLKQAFLNAGLDLWNDRASVNIKVLRWTLPQPRLNLVALSHADREIVLGHE